MRWVAAPLIVVVSIPLIAQHDRGSVGRAGGSRSAHEQEQSEILAQNNDPRFVNYRSFISQQLKKSVRQISVDYDKLVAKDVRLSPQQFLAVHLAARQNKMDPNLLAENVAPPVPSQGAVLSAPIAPDFEEKLASSLERLRGMNPTEARDSARKAAAAVPFIPPS